MSGTKVVTYDVAEARRVIDGLHMPWHPTELTGGADRAGPRTAEL
ncbi:MAG: hypothetical protein ACHQNA_01740 [Acidimicrobiales bacterium]